MDLPPPSIERRFSGDEIVCEIKRIIHHGVYDGIPEWLGQLYATHKIMSRPDAHAVMVNVVPYLFKWYNCSPVWREALSIMITGGNPTCGFTINGITQNLIMAVIDVHCKKQSAECFMSIIKMLVSQGIDINYQSHSGSAFQLLIRKKLYDQDLRYVIEEFINLGAIPKLDRDCWLSLMNYSRKTFIPIIKRILAAAEDYIAGQPEDMLGLRRQFWPDAHEINIELISRIPYDERWWFLETAALYGVHPRDYCQFIELARNGAEIDLEFLKHLIDLGMPVTRYGRIYAKFLIDSAKPSYIAALQIIIDAIIAARE